MEHAEQHDAFVDGGPKTSELEGKGIAGGGGKHIHGCTSIGETLLVQGLPVDSNQGVANCMHGEEYSSWEYSDSSLP